MDFARIYEKEIDQFFRGEDLFRYSKEKGNVWVAGRGRTFQVLTVEPPNDGRPGGGGQYEIAVRFKLQADHPYSCDKYSGYIAGDGWIIGRNTDGH